MEFWIKNERGQAKFKGGRHDWSQAAQLAANCPHFLPDDEDELVAEEERSCYNCRFRRWTERSFVCLKR
ncbi:hypothetical protein SAMN05660649_03870 [Desulfotomaculum arcticum]|uniref:Uncharacterized protein n=1 Tax=Desulfotruncus arcticus DSM 17038 TaxID=1121424 RepID=A0A1I2XC20_9FIRM|nr:hypothetical protein [Desulfotruncus arcticus]SFH10226.1 hypothetical protein SAMN05660649_03870 [Desulfotomaculum arcticum] [Desulfotruncus arcticus DSM 17038]